MRTKLYILFFLLAFITGFTTNAQSTYPGKEGERVAYEMQIDTPDSFISGICMMLREGDLIKASIVNEFGVSIINFTYNEKDDKVKLLYVFKPLDRWFIKRALRNDLKKIIKTMKEGGSEYCNKRHKLNYTFKLNNEIQG